MEPDAGRFAAFALAGTARLFRRGGEQRSRRHGNHDHLWAGPRLDRHDARARGASAAWHRHASDGPGFGVSARPWRGLCQTRRDAGWPPRIRKTRLCSRIDIDAVAAASSGKTQTPDAAAAAARELT